MIKKIPAIYRDGVFVPLATVGNLAEETTLEIDLHIPFDEVELIEGEEYSFEEALQLLHKTSGMLDCAISADEVRYIVESSSLARKNLWIG
jgi:hypothetical protein